MVRDDLICLRAEAHRFAALLADEAERIKLLDSATITESTEVWRYVVFDDTQVTERDGVIVRIGTDVVVDTWLGFVYVGAGDLMARAALDADSIREIDKYFLV